MGCTGVTSMAYIVGHVKILLCYAMLTESLGFLRCFLGDARPMLSQLPCDNFFKLTLPPINNEK